MAVNNLSFASAVDDWVKASEQRIEAVWKESTKRVVSAAQENLRTIVNVQTGFLRAGVRASTESMPPINPKAYPVEGKSYTYSEGEIVLVINGAQLGQALFIGWTAAYSAYVNFGTSKMAPRQYVGLAAMQWPRIVEEVTAELKGRSSAQ